MDGLLLLVIITLGFICVGSVSAGPNSWHRCDYGCKAYDVPICARNQWCTIRFVGRCMMDMYNCVYPQKAFQEVDDSQCGETWTAECTYSVEGQ